MVAESIAKDEFKFIDLMNCLFVFLGYESQDTF